MSVSNAAGLHFSSRDSAILCVSDGLERLMGDRALYLQLLGRFRDDYRGLGPRLRQALAHNVLATLRHRVHTLRGAAGMIGARTVCQLATALEPACHLPPAACAETVLLLDEALGGLLAVIDTVLEEAREAAPAGTMPAGLVAALPAGVIAGVLAEAEAGNEARIAAGMVAGKVAGMVAAAPAGAVADAALLDRLAHLLDTGDGAAIDVLEQSASPLAARLGVERYQRVAAAAHQFDFEAALAALAPQL